MGKGSIYTPGSTKALRSVLVLCSMVALIFFVRNVRPLLYSGVERVEEAEDISKPPLSPVTINLASLDETPVKKTTKDATKLSVPTYTSNTSAVVPPAVSNTAINRTQSQTVSQTRTTPNNEVGDVTAPNESRNLDAPNPQNNSTATEDEEESNEEENQALSSEGTQDNSTATNHALSDREDSPDSAIGDKEAKGEGDSTPEENGSDSKTDAAEDENSDQSAAGGADEENDS